LQEPAVIERIVEVEWEDSCGRCGWQSPAPWPGTTAPLCESVGYVLEEGERGIVITGGLTTNWEGTDRRTDCTTFIPRSAIRKVTELKRGRRN
jgi:hypothetical protein